jgi:hypothetical protein
MISYALLSSTLFSRRTFAAVVLTLLLIPYGAFFFGGLQKFHNDFVEADRFAEQCNGFLDSLGVSKAGFFVAPHYISLDYVNTHYPIKWSFIPDNERTLRLLLGNYHVDLLILPLGHYLTYDPIQKGLRTVLGDDTFRLTGTGTFMDQTYLVYHRKDRQIPAGATSPK